MRGNQTLCLLKTTLNLGHEQVILTSYDSLTSILNYKIKVICKISSEDGHLCKESMTRAQDTMLRCSVSLLEIIKYLPAIKYCYSPMIRGQLWCLWYKGCQSAANANSIIPMQFNYLMHTSIPLWLMSLIQGFWTVSSNHSSIGII